MRYADNRKTVIKRTGETAERGSVATPRLLSPYLPGGLKPREGVAFIDIVQPTYNRSRRRANGMVRRRRRVVGVAIPRAGQPWAVAE